MKGIALASLAIGVGAGLALIAACLPDLEYAPAPLPEPDAPIAAAGPSCGDGIIAPDRADAGEACDPGEAGAPGCSADCRIDCPGAIDPLTNHCYFVTTAVPTYEAALYTCGFQGAHVVTFGSAEERGFVHAWRESEGKRDPFWVGLSLAAGVSGYRAARDREPGWRAGCAGCYAAVGADASDIPLAPEVDAGGCVIDAVARDTYSGVPCAGREITVVCEREPPGSAIELRTGGYEISAADASPGKRWFYVPVSVTAEEARAGCNAIGGVLALFDSAAERETVLAQIQSVARDRDEGVWIGLAAQGDASFTWDDGKPESARPVTWGYGEPAGIATSTRRAAAFLPPPAVDVQLARASEENARRTYLCQR